VPDGSGESPLDHTRPWGNDTSPSSLDTVSPGCARVDMNPGLGVVRTELQEDMDVGLGVATRFVHQLVSHQPRTKL
jgi:hypothetical protein